MFTARFLVQICIKVTLCRPTAHCSSKTMRERFRTYFLIKCTWF